MNFRKLHRNIAPIVFLPLFISAVTGVAYRLSLSWLGAAGNQVGWLMSLHEGRYLGTALVPVYVLLVGLGLLGMIATGITLLRRRLLTVNPARKDGRWLHRWLAAIALLPLCISATTGVLYRLGRAWFGVSGQSAGFLLSLHQGSYLGTALKPIYVLLVGAGLVVLLVTGLQMTGLFRRRRSPAR